MLYHAKVDFGAVSPEIEEALRARLPEDRRDALKRGDKGGLVADFGHISREYAKELSDIIQSVMPVTTQIVAPPPEPEAERLPPQESIAQEDLLRSLALSFRERVQQVFPWQHIPAGEGAKAKGKGAGRGGATDRDKQM